MKCYILLIVYINQLQTITRKLVQEDEKIEIVFKE